MNDETPRTQQPGQKVVAAGPDEAGNGHLSTGKDRPPKHPISNALDSFLRHIDGIEFAATVVVSGAIDLVKQRLQDFTDAIKLPEGDPDSHPPEVRWEVFRRIHDAILRHRNLPYLRVPSILGDSLFLSLFAAYDAFTGNLLAALFRKRPELLLNIDRSFPVAELLRHDSIDDVKEVVINGEIDSFRRQSYVDQFKSLEKTFGIPLRKFPNWHAFVECSQRRNLLTHADGVVSTQYLAVCQSEGCTLPTDVAVGSQLQVNEAYVLTACDLVVEVGVKLGHVLWRKCFPDEAAKADEALHSQHFGFLEREQWSRANTFGEFFLQLPRISSERFRRLTVVNYAIGLRAVDRIPDAIDLLDSVDWSATSPDFRLAEAVLRDDVTSAAQWMKRIGKEGEYVNEEAYRRWPLFRTFRSTLEFQEAFEQLYGRPFTRELKEEAVAAQARNIAMAEELDKGLPTDQVTPMQETDGV